LANHLFDVIRRVTTFLLAVYLWLHAFFLLNIQSALISRVSGLIRLTTSEVLVFALLIIFSLLAASGFWKTLRSLAYIYFFPFVLLIYGFRVAYLALKALNKWLKEHQSPQIGRVSRPDQLDSLVIDSTSKSSEPEQAETGASKRQIREILRFLLRPFTRFMFLWCLLLLTTTHRSIVWLCLVVVLVHLARKIFFILEVLFFSGPWLAKLGTALPTGLHAAIAALSAVTSDTAPTGDLKNLWNQLNLWKRILDFLKNPYLLSRWAWLLGIVFLGSLYLYIALLFSFVYYGMARLHGVPYPWVDALVSSIFVPFFVSDLPKFLVMRVVGALHCVLVLTVGIGTVANFLRRKLDALRKAATELSDRLAEQSLQQKYLILEQKVTEPISPPPNPAAKK
jgi:hypothetical protein